ncbi:hypothetical protein [Peribacillus simplex]|uniref:hypothetical protein n=1 Tax=Peribacillus simplex TaxID=1478 RepID=UPI0024C1E011|nr:hypothetical protein [Peribacillus simplex]WHY98269.1 hypothetical protein QNH37_03455 [Peribacillus simplex]
MKHEKADPIAIGFFSYAAILSSYTEANICWNKLLTGWRGLDEFPIIEKMPVVLPFFILS